MVVEIKLQSIFRTKIGPNEDLVQIWTKVQFFAGGGFGSIVWNIKTHKLIKVICEEPVIIANYSQIFYVV